MDNKIFWFGSDQRSVGAFVPGANAHSILVGLNALRVVADGSKTDALSRLAVVLEAARSMYVARQGDRNGEYPFEKFRTECSQCWLCGIHTPPTFMLHDDLWRIVTRERVEAELCIECAEKELDRPITPADLKQARCNLWWMRRLSRREQS